MEITNLQHEGQTGAETVVFPTVDPLKEMGKIFRAARGNVSQEAFAESLDITQSHLSKLERGSVNPGRELLVQFLRVTKDKLSHAQLVKLLRMYHGWEDDPAAAQQAREQEIEYQSRGRFPKAGRSALGRFVEAIANDGRPLSTEKKFTEPWLDAAELGSDAAFVVDVDGDSMEPTILDGSEVLVDPKAELRDGDIAWVWFEGKSTVKRWTKKKNTLFLRPDNPKHEAIILTPDEWKSGNGIAFRVLASRLSKRH
jgi:phage repressor protein C with HTH and peptisase S24 domain